MTFVLFDFSDGVGGVVVPPGLEGIGLLGRRILVVWKQAAVAPN